VIKCVSDLRQIGGFLRIFRLLSPIKCSSINKTDTPRYSWNIVESGVKYNKHNPITGHTWVLCSLKIPQNSSYNLISLGWRGFLWNLNVCSKHNQNRSYQNQSQQLFVVHDWRTTKEFLNYKAPTCVLFTPDKTFHSFGYDAINYYHNNTERKQLQDWYYFEHFKMMLYLEKVNTSNTIITRM
jgi:hypothetical protein